MGVSFRRFTARMRRRSGQLQWLPVVFVSVLLFMCFAAYVGDNLRPAIETMALSDANNRISLAVSRAVADCVAEYGLSYSDFITIERDTSGNITALSNRLTAASELRSRMVQAVTEQVSGLSEQTYEIPLGTLTGWLIFSDRGPGISVRILSAGDVRVDTSHNFEQAGINQTLHQVFLDVSVSVYLLIPGNTLETTMDNRICVAETVLVGDVPDTYLTIGGDSRGYKGTD